MFVFVMPVETGDTGTTPRLYGMLTPAWNFDSSLSTAMMLGVDTKFVCDDVASAVNSTAYDGMLVPRIVCDDDSGPPDQTDDDEERRHDRSQARRLIRIDP